MQILLCDKSDCFAQLVFIAGNGEAARGKGQEAADRKHSSPSRPTVPLDMARSLLSSLGRELMWRASVQPLLRSRHLTC